MRAPKPTRPPAAALTLGAAAPVAVDDAPEPVAVPLREPEAPEPEAPEPEATALLVEATRSTVVLLPALTVTVRVWLKAEPVPARVKVWRPGPTAGMLSGRGCEVTTAGCEVTTDGWAVTMVAWEN